METRASQQPIGSEQTAIAQDGEKPGGRGRCRLAGRVTRRKYMLCSRQLRSPGILLAVLLALVLLPPTLALADAPGTRGPESSGQGGVGNAPTGGTAGIMV